MLFTLFPIRTPHPHPHPQVWEVVTRWQGWWPWWLPLLMLMLGSLALCIHCLIWHHKNLKVKNQYPHFPDEGRNLRTLRQLPQVTCTHVVETALRIWSVWLQNPHSWTLHCMAQFPSLFVLWPCSQFRSTRNSSPPFKADQTPPPLAPKSPKLPYGSVLVSVFIILKVFEPLV